MINYNNNNADSYFHHYHLCKNKAYTVGRNVDIYNRCLGVPGPQWAENTCIIVQV